MTFLNNCKPGWSKYLGIVPSCHLIRFSKHRGSSCKIALAHHQQHMVPNFFQTIHRFQQNIPLTIFTKVISKTFLSFVKSFFFFFFQKCIYLTSQITKSSLILYIAGSSASPSLWCWTFTAYRCIQIFCMVSRIKKNIDIYNKIRSHLIL